LLADEVQSFPADKEAAAGTASEEEVPEEEAAGEEVAETDLAEGSVSEEETGDEIETVTEAEAETVAEVGAEPEEMPVRAEAEPGEVGIVDEEEALPEPIDGVETEEAPGMPERPAEDDAAEEVTADLEVFGDEDDEYEPIAESEDEILSFWRQEVEPMTPVEAGTVIEGRFAVVEALDVQEGEILYLARDMTSCWQCAYEENDPEGTFCARCGVLMDKKPEVRLLEIAEPEATPSTDMIVLAHLGHDSRHFLLLAEPVRKPEPEAEVLPEPESFRLLVGQRSDPGQIRELDEDSLFVLTLSPTYESRTGPVLGLFAVADGMGGHASGEVASRMALQELAGRVMRTVILPEIAGQLVWEDDILTYLRQATIAANDTVYLARQKRENDMGTTLTTILIRDDRLFLAHVGDCRVYRFNVDGLEQLTTDHSVVASMIAEGQAQPEELYTHPHRNIVYRCIGDKPVVEVDTDLLPLSVGDRIVLCCDGLWEMVRDEGIEDVLMQEADPQTACDLLVRRANAAGGEDNISVILVQVEASAELDALEDED
jgi:serine/threonine protein phosphatase PrpC